jgi:hypothetical protein
MSQYRNGYFSAPSSGGVTIPLGFLPDHVNVYDVTVLKAPASGGIAKGLWINQLPYDSAVVTTYTTVDAVTSVPVDSYITSTGVNIINLGGDWQNTQYTITNVTQANPGVVTISVRQPTNTLLLANGMTVTISSVSGMTQLNTNRYIVANYAAGGGTTATFSLYDLFGNPVNTLGFGAYSSGGICNEISYPPTAAVVNPVTGQITTPAAPAGLQYDIGYQGMILGQGLFNASTDIIWWEAWTETPTGW